MNDDSNDEGSTAGSQGLTGGGGLSDERHVQPDPSTRDGYEGGSSDGAGFDEPMPAPPVEFMALLLSGVSNAEQAPAIVGLYRLIMQCVVVIQFRVHPSAGGSPYKTIQYGPTIQCLEALSVGSRIVNQCLTVEAVKKGAMTRRDAAFILNVHENTVARWVKDWPQLERTLHEDMWDQYYRLLAQILQKAASDIHQWQYDDLQGLLQAERGVTAEFGWIYKTAHTTWTYNPEPVDFW